ncbi:TRAP-type C4-dicarboxylate transport system permease small subunit [Melghirimyces profundicolus]|uniref:TRAP-type C4-dicarboxylate transport system permease small subunit n=1 Tax=Melghirimyces profundicolus TaxID=1242148 RepID=A0A2T6BD55_9BACL|nr:TRAP transporter small permease [Melghirimyces profundicolus]PTX53976.1 TRAP-type C4-dicarboxylate transport system permease small subunit [Melghirimyces profundicolus]
MKILMKMEKWIHHLVHRFIQVLLVLTVLIVLVQVGLRYFFSYTPSWSEELTLVLLIWISFIGIAVGFRENLHIAVEFVVNRFPEGVRNGLEWLTRLLVLVLGCLFIYFGGQFTIMMSNTAMPGTQLPLAVMYFCIPTCGLLMILYTFFNAILPKSDGAEEEGDE